MKPRDLVELVVLAALWGASFMFMRVAIADFGAAPLAATRLLGGAVLLLGIVVWRHGMDALRGHSVATWGRLAVVGIVGSALPFVFFALAAPVLNTGTMSIVNATTPLWVAVIAAAWLGERLAWSRVAGLLLGLVGVGWLTWDQGRGAASADGASPALGVALCLAATLSYGFSATFTKRFPSQLPALTTAALSVSWAALVLLLPAVWQRPAAMPSALSWGSAAALAVLCTGLAYLLYFRLLASAGPTNASTVTFLIPAFAVMWGTWLLNEPFTAGMGWACGTVVLGTALATGWLQGLWPRRRVA
jgi:drug/metabolite transporter (DMT)-like permease